MQKESIKEALEARAGRRKGTGKPYGFPMSFLYARSLRPSGAGEGWQFRPPACSLTVQYLSESIVPLHSKEHRIQEEPIIFILPSIEIRIMTHCSEGGREDSAPKRWRNAIINMTYI